MNPIRQMRREAGITQQALADRAGTSQSTIAAYEAGAKFPTWRTIDRLAAALGLEPVITFTPSMSHADFRSLCLHRAIGDVLKQNPDAALRRARQHLRRLASMHPHARELLERWKEWLDGPVDELVAKISDPGAFAREMRQVSPLVGILSQRERIDILKRARRDRPA